VPAIIDSLRRDHRNMEQLLKMLEQELAVFDQAEKPDFGILSGIVDYFRSYPDCCHHPKEDLIFVKLKERHPDGAMAMVDIEAEHSQAHQRLGRLARLIEDVINEQEVPRQSLDEAVADFITHERHHMEIEEREFLPAALENLTEEDWAELDAKISDAKDPLFDPEAEARFELLAKRLRRWEREDQAERAWLSQGR